MEAVERQIPSHHRRVQQMDRDSEHSDDVDRYLSRDDLNDTIELARE
jgi:hypothetical protein